GKLDDAKIRALLHHGLARRALARKAPVRAWHLDPLHLLEPPLADVALVAEHLADGADRPSRPPMTHSDPRRRDAFAVQRTSYRAHAPTASELRKDTDHDLRSDVDNFDLLSNLAAVGIDEWPRAISVGHLSCGEAREHSAFQAAQSLVTKIIEVEIRHET